MENFKANSQRMYSSAPKLNFEETLADFYRKFA